jgi:ATP-binding cassette subfamily B protein
LRLEGVRFGYDAAKPVLKDIDLWVRPGEVVALVGPSGAGKSTLFSLLLRFNTAQAGRVLLDGQNLADLRARELRQAVALVPQQSSVFSGTGAEAIAFGRAASLEAIQAAARLANASGFIEALPDGYGSRVEERGANFSGGQLQRLAIARAWAQAPELLFLDEPSSHLDPGATRQIEEMIAAMAAEGMTILMTTHDLGQARRLAQRVLFFNRGRLVEDAPAGSFFTGPASPEAQAFIAGDLLW